MARAPLTGAGVTTGGVTGWERLAAGVDVEVDGADGGAEVALFASRASGRKGFTLGRAARGVSGLMPLGVGGVSAAGVAGALASGVLYGGRVGTST